MADDRKPPPPPAQGKESDASQSDASGRKARRAREEPSAGKRDADRAREEPSAAGRAREEPSAPSNLAAAHLPLLDDGDLILRALRGLPDLPLAAAKDARVHARATAQLLETAARHRRTSDKATSKTALALARAARRFARPILPLSVAGFALGYLIWAVRTAATFLP
jgi:hypothetical protein